MSETRVYQDGAELARQAGVLETRGYQHGVQPIRQAATLEMRAYQFGVEVIGIWEDDSFINICIVSSGR